MGYSEEQGTKGQNWMVRKSTLVQCVGAEEGSE